LRLEVSRDHVLIQTAELQRVIECDGRLVPLFFVDRQRARGAVEAARGRMRCITSPPIR
jgi:hypothetical protein